MALATLSIDLEAKLANLERDFSKASRLAEQNAQKIKASYAEVNQTFEMLGATLASAVGVNFAVTLIQNAIDAQDKLKDLSKSTSLTVETLAGLSSMANKTGGDIEGIADSINKLAVNMGKDSEKFAKLGIDAKDPLEAFKQLADVFNSIEDPQKRAAFAAEALGKSWKSSAPALSEGSEAIAKMVERGQTLSKVTSESADRADEFNDNLTDLKSAAGGLATEFANSLVPSLTDTVKAMTDSIEKGNTLEAVLRGIAGIGKLPFDAILGNVDMSQAGYIKDLQNELIRLEQNRATVASERGLLSKWLYGTTDELDQKILITKNQLEALQKFGDKIAPNPAEKSGQAAPNEKDLKEFIGGKTGGSEPKEKRHKFNDYDATLTERISKAIEQTDVVKADELAASLEKLNQLAAAGLDPAIVKSVRDDLTGATKAAADELARLNALLGATESGQIAATTKDMELLTKALEGGRISEEQYLEAVQTRLDKNNEKIKEGKTLAEELGLTFTSAFEDAVSSGGDFSSVLKGLEQDIIRLIMRMTVTEPLLKAFKDSGGASGIISSIGSYFSSSSATTVTPSANGNVYSSPSLSAYSGQIVSKPTMFAFASGAGVMGEAGPEAIMPLKRGKDGKLGVSTDGGGVVVNVINNTGAETSTKKRSDGQGGSIIDVFIEQAKNAIAGDIASGNGSVPAAMSGAYGLKRTAGAY